MFVKGINARSAAKASDHLDYRRRVRDGRRLVLPKAMARIPTLKPDLTLVLSGRITWCWSPARHVQAGQVIREPLIVDDC